jgi:hypothetical protein
MKRLLYCLSLALFLLTLVGQRAEALPRFFKPTETGDS